MTLKILENEEKVQLSDLAEKLDIRAPSLSEMLSRMTPHDFVSRTKDEGDSRIIYVSITEKGREHMKKSEEVFNEMRNEVLTAEEQIMFGTICQKLIAYFEAKGSDVEADDDSKLRHHQHKEHGPMKGVGNAIMESIVCRLGMTLET